ncbi:hypothetical protein ACA910_003778 [Epithemia clementina (nom. ined.)]
MAYATVYRFNKAGGKTAETDLPASQAAADALDPKKDVAELAAARRNEIAFANLTMALRSQQCVGLLRKAKTTAWPQGLAWKVVDQLHKKFAPTDMASKIEMRKMINNVSMKPHEDPATLFEQISAIKNMFNVEIDDDNKVAIAMTTAPDEYQGILTSEQNRCAAAGTTATPDQIEYVMNTYWRNVHGKRLHNSAAN